MHLLAVSQSYRSHRMHPTNQRRRSLVCESLSIGASPGKAHLLQATGVCFVKSNTRATWCAHHLQGIDTLPQAILAVFFINLKYLYYINSPMATLPFQYIDATDPGC
jgi:hypothetical protein